MQTLRDRNDAVSGVPCDVAGLDITAVFVANSHGTSVVGIHQMNGTVVCVFCC